MKLKDRIDTQFAHLRSRFDLIDAKYASFISALSFFSRREVAALGVSVEQPSAERNIKASFGTVTISFRLLHSLSAEGSAIGRVVCILESPTFGSECPLIGSFTVNTQGFTDFEVPVGTAFAEIEYSAPEIVLHFLHLALARPLPSN